MFNKKQVPTLILLGVAVSFPLHAHEGPYWEDSSGNIVRSGSGECWRTSYWSESNSLAECEGGMKKPAPKKPAMMKTAMADADKDGVADSKDQCPDTPVGMRVTATGCPSDSDGDGASDIFDKCPDTPPGMKVDATGCPVDSDGDGASDVFDKCPDTPKGIKVDATGCPMDSDGDGAADSYDRCPGTPKGVTVDSMGCAVSMDDDNDGIMNANDDCAGTAPGTVVNSRGCELEQSIALDNVQFTTGTSILSSTSRNILDNIAETLRNNPHLNFEVAGHTDSSGNYQANVNLSQSRAQSVRQYLIDNGVAANRLTAKGYGPDKPVASNNTRSGRSANRRVELILR